MKIFLLLLLLTRARTQINNLQRTDIPDFKLEPLEQEAKSSGWCMYRASVEFEERFVVLPFLGVQNKHAPFGWKEPKKALKDVLFARERKMQRVCWADSLNGPDGNTWYILKRNQEWLVANEFEVEDPPSRSFCSCWNSGKRDGGQGCSLWYR